MHRTLKSVTAGITLLSLLSLLLLSPQAVGASPLPEPSPDLRASLALVRWDAERPGALPPELKEIQKEESEFAQRKAAAIAKIGGGTILGSVSVLAGIGLGALGLNKSKKEDKDEVPDSKRTSGYYYLGGLLVGLGGGSWGFNLRHQGKVELDNLVAHKIAFGLDSNGHPVISWLVSF